MCGACLAFENLNNADQAEGFERYKADLWPRLAARYAPATLVENKVLAGFRDLHDTVGRSNRKFPSSSERMLAIFLKYGFIAPINLAVDIYNCVSLETLLSLGAHDIDKIRGNISLRLTDGSEHFTPLGKEGEESVPAGEYAYVEDGGEVLCRMECRQAERTKVTVESRHLFYMIQGNANTEAANVAAAVDKLVELPKRYCGGAERVLWSG